MQEEEDEEDDESQSKDQNTHSKKSLFSKDPSSRKKVRSVHSQELDTVRGLDDSKKKKKKEGKVSSGITQPIETQNLLPDYNSIVNA